MRYIGMDIGKSTTVIAILDGDQIQIQILEKPTQLASILKEGDHIAAEWTGALAKPWLDEALKYTPSVSIYRTQGIRTDKRVVGNRDKNDLHDATAIAKLLKIQSELNSPRFIPYKDLQEVLELRRIVYEAEQFTRERVRTEILLKNAEATGYQVQLKNSEFLKELKHLENQAWKRARKAVQNHPITSRLYETLLVLYPEAQNTIIKIAVHIAPLERWRNARTLRRYAGLYDQRAQSGNQIKRQGLQGNKHLRTALYQLACGAVRPLNR